MVRRADVVLTIGDVCALSVSCVFRSGKVVLTSEPNNLMNINSFKYSGLANSKAVGIDFDQDAKGRPCASMTLKV